ncbi:hypothetical protein PLIIFM63780_000947 [Purpureocillium lilacinum]|uniref:Uncharacterized protein n=1 Tax=Purpureocillium lilacinum TaxID=33203 RepID=A0ABR0C7Q0_PURLI|nr:hypothetical protein Purlil1_3034 [Purpureocillium lilacinum]GJN77456.1 hypothetical protein PLIIFM63780_000947 [Purpureocillium lilacinum]
MDVTAENFWQLLPNMLEAIAAADYVAVDLEMSGVMVRDSLTTGEVSFEQAYARLRSAANTFSAIELGITTMRFVESSYQTQTFTIPISAIIPRHTREDAQLAKLLDRRLTLSSNSLRFLEEHGFDMDRTLGGGVPYLSREEMELLSEHSFSGGRAEVEPVDVSSLVSFDRCFYERLVETLKAWLASKPKPGTALEIPEPRGGNLRRSTISLVNHVVASEFPQCRCWRQRTGDAMSVSLRDAKKQDEIERRESEAKITSLAKNFGMSWIVEALIGFEGESGYENMANIVRTQIVASPEDGQPSGRRDKADQRKWQTLIEKLAFKSNNRVLIGHNLVWDLAFLYGTFRGPLPPTVGEFSTLICETFPRLVDTKLLLRETVDPNVVDETLEEVYLGLQRQAYPYIETAVDGWGFAQVGDKKGAAHHAGYDMVFLKLCCKRCRVVKRALAARDAGVQHAKDPGDILASTSWLGIVDDQLSAMDRYLYGDEIRIPAFDGEFFRSVRNRLRMSTAGVLVLRGTISSPWNRSIASAADAEESAARSSGGGGPEDDDVFAAKMQRRADKPTTDLTAHQMWGVLKADLSRFMSSIYDFDREFECPGGLEKFHAMVDALDEDMEKTRGKIASYLAGARGMGHK